MLVRSKIVQKMFGVEEVLVAAKKLVSMDGIEVACDVSEVEYFHILFDRHEIIFANGAASESLFTGKQALKTLGAGAMREIHGLLPQSAADNYVPTPARKIVTGHRCKALVARHVKNRKTILGNPIRNELLVH